MAASICKKIRRKKQALRKLMYSGPTSFPVATNSSNAGVYTQCHITSHCFALPRTFPLLIFAFSLSTKSFMMSCNASLRRVIKRTSSVVIVFRPAWREKDSRSAETFSKDLSGWLEELIRSFTYLCPYHLGQCAYELRSCVGIKTE